MTDDLKDIWAKVDARNGPQRMETEAEHIARDMREGIFPKRSDPIQVPVSPPSGMTDAPERMFVRGKPNGAMGRWHDATSLHETAAITSGGGGNPMFSYILATPEALAASPEVQALIREAEARGMERAAEIDWQRGRDMTDLAPDFLSDWQRGLVAGQQMMRDAIRAEAAAIRETQP